MEPFDRIYSNRESVETLAASSSTPVPAEVVRAAAAGQAQRAVRSSYVLSGSIAAMAQDLMNQGRESEAFAVLDEWLPNVRPPATADLIAMAGVLHLRAGRTEAGQQALDQARSIDPENRIVQRVLDPSRADRPIHLGTTKQTPEGESSP